MKFFTLLIAAGLLMIYSNLAWGQFLQVSDDNQTLNCALFGNQASSNFIDSGNQGAGYTSNEQDTITICPDLINGTKVSLRMGNAYGFPFDIDPSDTLYIYDGVDASAPLLGAFNNNNIGSGFSLIASFNSNPSGCLTIIFSSDGANEGTGWEGNIACTTPAQPFDATVEAYINGAMPDVFDSTTGTFMDICIYDSILFIANPTFPYSFENNGFGYSQTPENVEYIWTLSDGTLLTNNDSVWFVPPGVGGYYINLEIKDSYPLSVKNYGSIRVGTVPVFAPTAIIDDSLCLGDSAIISTGPVNYPDGIFETNTFFEKIQNQLIPDGDGNNYVANNMVSSFNGATLVDATSIDEICLDIEHTDLSNLEIVVECPNGTQLTLVNASNASGGLVPGGYLSNGIALGDPSTVAGVQGTTWRYCFDMNAALGSFPNETGNLVTAPSNATILTMDEDTYQPEESFGALAGCPIDGTWKLIVRDNIQTGANDGYVSGWRISFDKTLDPNAPTFTNNVVNEGWQPSTTIVSTNPDTSIWVLPTQYGYTGYTYEATDDFGCTHDTVVSIYVTQPPVLPNDTLLCDDTLFAVDAFASSGGYWTSSNPSEVSFNDSTLNNPDVYFSALGIYTLYFTDTVCGMMDSMEVNHGFRPSIFTDTNICADTFQVTNTVSYQGGVWSATNGILFNDNLADNPLSYVGLDGQSYTYTFIDNACLDTLTSVVSFYPDLSFSPDTLVCDSLSSVVVFNSENSGSWSSDSLQITFVNPNDTITDVYTSEYGNYDLYYTDNICGSIDTINITFAYPPRTNFIDTVVCDSSFQVYNVDSWDGGTWTNPFPDVISIIDDTLDNPLIELDTAGTFAFIYTDNQCSISDTLRISFYGEPQIIGTDTLCGLQNEVYLADTMYAGGVWTTNDPINISFSDPFSSDTAYILAQDYGSYMIYFTDFHCNKTDSLAQIFIEPANITGTNDTITCDGIHQVTGVVAPNGGNWINPDPTNIVINSESDNNPLITLNAFGSYNFVFVQNTCGNVVNMNISYFDAPNIIGLDTVCGLNDAYTVNSVYPSGGTWTTNAPEISFSSPSTATTDITASTFGSFWVYYQENYCNKEDSMFITFLAPAVTNTLQDTILCGNSYQVTGVNSLSGGTWTNPSPTDLSFSNLNANNPLITVNNFGTYTLTYTQNTCGNTTSFNLTYLDKPEILANDTTCNNVISLTIASNFPNGGTWSTNAPEVSLNTPTSTSTNATASATGSYWVYYTENNCGTQDSILLTYASAPIFNLSDTTICDNLYPVSGVSSFNGGSWSANDPSVIFSDVNVDNPNITLLNPGTYSVTFTDGQCGVTNTINITLIADPQIVGSPNTCIDVINLSLANSFVQGGSWSSNSTDLSFDNPTADAVTITNTNDGTYWVYYTENQCNHIDSLEITFYGPPTFTLTDSLICDTIFTAIGVTSSNGGTWSVTPNLGATVLTPNTDNPDIQFFNTGVYTFVYTDNQCGFTDSVTYEFIGYPQATITENMIICPNQVPVVISVNNLDNVDSLVWFDGTQLPSTTVESEGYWTIQLFNDCHIREMGTEINFEFCGIEVPNVITPNGDGMNDVLTLNVGEIDEFYILIVNRWGNVVYESNDVTEAWDGTNKESGRPCTDGTYFYKVTYKQTSANQLETVEGFVTIVTK